ncbi:MAG: flagellar hook protein FlgE [Planctomycetota bacterium]
MASTVSLYTGLSGLVGNSRMLEVVGNNISNTNSTAYKSNRLLLEPTFARTFSSGTEPNEAYGGTNPSQIGLGVSTAGTQRDFQGGALSTTGINTDLAIEGDGFFIVENNSQRYYTRAGAFRRNSENELVTVNGEQVLGYGVDDNFNINTGNVGPLSIPVGSLTIAEATRNVHLSGNLNAGGDVAQRGSLINFDALNVLAGASPPPEHYPHISEDTRLLDVSDGTGAPQFENGQTLRLTGAEKGGRIVPDADLSIGASTTIGDMLQFLREALGVMNHGESTAPGSVALDATTGVISIEGNSGVANDMVLDTADLVVVDGTGAAIAQPFVTNKMQDAHGESVRTTFVTYDSLGTPLEIDMTLVLESKSDGGTTWRYYMESKDNVGRDIRLGDGLVSFDSLGRALPPSDVNVGISRDQTGAIDPLNFSMAFTSDSGDVTALTDVRSNVSAIFQDGSAIGTLSDFSVGEDGVINGAFSNGLVRDIGQVAIATFINPEGLVYQGNNVFQPGPNSGTAVITAPQELSAGKVVSSTLELSNVDLSQEFINLILAQTGYSAAGRVVNTANQLFQQLMALAR